MQTNLTQSVFPTGTMLGSLDPEAFRALSSIWTEASFAKGQQIMNAEDANSDICFLLKGEARVAIFTSSGREVSVSPLTAGDCFGEFSAIDGAPRSANIEAEQPCVAARIGGDRFRQVLRNQPEVAFAFLLLLVAKLRDLTAKVTDFNAHNADQRIRGEILRLAEAVAGERDNCRVERPPTQSEIAARIFSNREAVAREMGRLRRAGLIARDGRTLIVPSLERLRDHLDTVDDI